MARQFTRSYTHDHEVNADGSVAFTCSTEFEAWPWLTLGPHHPVVVQAQNFWCSVGAILKLDEMQEGQWSALTWTEWVCGEAGVSDAVRGTYERERSGKDRRYLITLFDAEDREVVRMRGRGVVFRTRNFEEWRGEAKREAKWHADRDNFEFAPRELLGIGECEHSLVGLGTKHDPDTIPALVTSENGLPPANPMLGGSGDHVNSVHMIEAARQAMAVLKGGPDFEISGGEMHLNRYVELGTPFSLRVENQSESEVGFQLDQLGKPCAEITLRFGDA
ncbi:hypothetical protein [Erythrobacter sp. THAF29]|uniref:hypothetical protein n=1 Tax=Erythrobacter sp. THAF29 TaxID=2587851 RepID=UPI00126846CB|nr:hypothetical protein [Erythrobacter sp. THAF29]QFT76753.1 hypothetical protein FIU90_04260 [Erythrobacter sp. THAF29]